MLYNKHPQGGEGPHKDKMSYGEGPQRDKMFFDEGSMI